MNSEFFEHYLDDFVNAFYFAGQGIIGQDDGGIAGLFESADECKENLLRPMLETLVMAVGEAEFVAQVAKLWSSGEAWNIRAKLADISELHDSDVRDLAKAAVGEFFLRISVVFPSANAGVLDSYMSEAALLMESYLNLERSFAQEAANTLSV